MDSRKRVRRLINREPADRIAIFDSFWTQTLADFRAQGMPAEIWPEDYFDFDISMFWFEQSFLLPEEVIEEDDEYRLVRDEWGTLNKEFREEQTTPGLLGFAIETREQWEQEYKPLLAYDPATRIDWKPFEARYQHFRERDRYVALSMLDPFECTWHKVGPEKQLMLTIQDPAWLQDMYAADVQLISDAWRDLQTRGIQPDALWLYGDIAYNKGMLFSPRHYRKLLLPFHRQLCELAHADGAQVIYHSDGDLTKAVPLLIEAGVDCIQPMEVKAGMDVVALKEAYGDQLAFMGNIDAQLFQSNDRDGLKTEIERKIPAAMAGGGYVYHSDHSIPPGATLETYQYALSLVREIGQYPET